MVRCGVSEHYTPEQASNIHSQESSPRRQALRPDTTRMMPCGLTRHDVGLLSDMCNHQDGNILARVGEGEVFV